ncbi:tryptophan 2,3-dioxygenase [Actinomadura macrotermitis]|uniref:Tryptophan 2,3-dioxygenase n=1 Tax=Actinomadura macrotermitis TaxID=2585200 RepID=A0A7K0C7K5_9ACTN|nr:tryptophan 2,3-dioxygenase family protein [Actinomadura macrotermitis]MQY09415.1 Tryptophan 2,3-dioxygenase [Actinomadura macrotermitis]
MLKRSRRGDGDEDLTYEGYLGLDRLLTAQHPLADPPHHDELLFIIQHQTAELWTKLLLHEMAHLQSLLREDDLIGTARGLERVYAVQAQMIGQWSVIATLTPESFTEFRPVLGDTSGFQSAQLRAWEFKLGNKRPEYLEHYRRSAQRELLERALNEPTLYDDFLRFLLRAGHPVPESCLGRLFSGDQEPDQTVVAALRRIYEDRDHHRAEYEMAERLVELEERHQLWRFQHTRTVRRIIGERPGTGGKGVPYLADLVGRPLFPEIFAARDVIGPGS